MNERKLRIALIIVALGGLASGTAAWAAGQANPASLLWAAGTLPVIVALAASIMRDFLAGRMGVDAVALVSMSAALLLGENLAAAVVAVMYAGGTVLEEFAVSRAERDLKLLVDRAPRVGHKRLNSEVIDVPVDDLRAGDVLLVRAGEVIPVDGTVVSNVATLDEQAVTGEPIPVERRRGARISSGTVNAGEAFEMHASGRASESTYAGIIRMVTAAQTAKAPFIRIADRFAILLLPATLGVAVLAWYLSGSSTRALAVLVAATPCPLILAAPVAFIAGVSRAARRGILIKGGSALEALASVRTVMFDKTGTLTVGGANLVAVVAAPAFNEAEVMRLAGSLEQSSQHIVAAALVSAAVARGAILEAASDVTEARGAGLEGNVGRYTVRAGSQDYVVGEATPLEAWAAAACAMADHQHGLTVFVAVDGTLAGVLVFADQLRPEVSGALARLRDAGVTRIVMVTGDHQVAADKMAQGLDLDQVFARHHPNDKVEAVTREQHAASTIMVGDGINDAPALAAADVGVAMSARGASASSEAADVVILVDRIDRVADAVDIAQRARSIAMQSVVAGMVMSGIAMILAAFGWLTPVGGALTQEVIDVAVILNALRALSGGAMEEGAKVASIQKNTAPVAAR